MTKVILLEQLKEFTKIKTKDMLLPVRQQEEDVEAAGEEAQGAEAKVIEVEPLSRPPEVFLMRLPDFRSVTKKAPYVLHQIIMGGDTQPEGESEPYATAVVRTVFCVSCADEQEGSMYLLNLMERLRIALLEEPLIGGQFELDLTAGLETVPYSDNANAADRTAPYYLGEMISTWKLPRIKRKDCKSCLKMQQIPLM